VITAALLIDGPLFAHLRAQGDGDELLCLSTAPASERPRTDSPWQPTRDALRVRGHYGIWIVYV